MLFMLLRLCREPLKERPRPLCALQLPVKVRRRAHALLCAWNGIDGFEKVVEALQEADLILLVKFKARQ